MSLFKEYYWDENSEFRERHKAYIKQKNEQINKRHWRQTQEDGRDRDQDDRQLQQSRHRTNRAARQQHAPIPEPDTFKSFYIYGKPSQLKKDLKLDVDQKVSIKRIPELEDRLNIRINVKGDHCYASTSRATREVNLILTNGHYKLDKEGTYAGKGIRYTRYNERDVYIKPIVFKYLKGEQVQLYDYGEHTTISLEQFINKKRRKYQDKCEYIRILSGMTLEETLDSFKADADMLKEHTNGVIDMYTTGQNINKAAIKLFLSYNKTVKPEPIGQMEGEWIKKSAYGPLMMAIQHVGALYKYDVARMYASILRSGGFMIPIKCGDFQHLTDEELSAMKSIPFGIYRATIVGTHGAFKHNKSNYYTHYDLIFAKELGLTFNLKTGKKANALIYDSSCRKFCSDLFGKYIDQVLGWIDACEPKSRLEELCKCLYQRLWGALSKRNKTKQCANMECDAEVIETSDGQRTIKHVEIPFPRIMPFIISRGRKMIGTIIKDDIDCIKRVHTDGFVSTKPWTEKTGKKSLDYPKLGKECGDLRYEGYCPNAYVKNMTKPVGSFAIGTTVDRSGSNTNKSYMQQYYEEYKEEIKAYNTERIPCEVCGKLIWRHLMRKHERRMHLVE
ncbi:hypothetical protein SAMD00019534_062550 [Acytostelium subglobosum LB1]|uniref:hypothetical protein n=1 Tax=Acytostelium subglobosum LB1 TaxID=1410327 RepID=UPI0006448B81|nr:hypothetical protein SAMD00019534_062550 [Acytostelium subglobosum LB1]GAM23080.1 hypothetical protein SAMD00019534_062550 [Acytostelium subglobosum LB1]|eukprot:XP_012754307.1 hypothetical protein SAMD00019534_062550 [Acytostelium subglobosum LB1]